MIRLLNRLAYLAGRAAGAVIIGAYLAWSWVRDVEEPRGDATR